MSFELYKRKAVEEFEKHKKLGKVDEDILKELEDFNKLADYYTTSSCSGRILLVKNPGDASKTPNAFYYKTHQKTTPKIIMEKIRKYNNDYELWFKLESFILHIGCRTLEHARKLLSLCKKVGIKRAGINAWSKRIVVEVLGTQSIETIVVKDRKILVDENYVKILVEKANNRLKNTKDRIHSFFKNSKYL